ncbi:hypothetical protein R6G99_08740, partial [Actinotignum timonense]|nr:hypothetical protein [Actinotignum timonense]
AWAALGAADPSLLHSAAERDLRDFLANPEVDPATETLALYRGEQLLAGATVSTMGDVDQDDDLDIYIGYACLDLEYLPELLSRCEQLAIGLAERSETRYSGLSVQVARDDDAEETNAAQAGMSLGARGRQLRASLEHWFGLSFWIDSGL